MLSTLWVTALSLSRCRRPLSSGVELLPPHGATATPHVAPPWGTSGLGVATDMKGRSALALGQRPYDSITFWEPCQAWGTSLSWGEILPWPPFSPQNPQPEHREHPHFLHMVETLIPHSPTSNPVLGTGDTLTFFFPQGREAT